jgi:hypothetical protein
MLPRCPPAGTQYVSLGVAAPPGSLAPKCATLVCGRPTAPTQIPCLVCWYYRHGWGGWLAGWRGIGTWTSLTTGTPFHSAALRIFLAFSFFLSGCSLRPGSLALLLPPLLEARQWFSFDLSRSLSMPSGARCGAGAGLCHQPERGVPNSRTTALLTSTLG